MFFGALPRTNMKAWLACVVVCSTALLLYLSTAAPSLTWAHAGADGGDLISAALTNGVAHPPGYPTYVTIGQLVARIPIGDVAYRFTLLSAVSMALAAGFTTLSFLWLSHRAAVSSVAGLFFATAPAVWGQATITEVYALNAALVAGIVYLITPIVFRRQLVSLFRLVLAAWLWGVAFGNSVTVAALAPLVIVAWWRVRTSTVARRAMWLPLIAFAIGLSVYLLIPLRAAAHPFINWGDATTPDRFVALISAELYRGYALSTTPQEFLTRVVAFAQLIVMQYGWIGVALGMIGVYRALITTNHNWRWLALTIVLYLLFALSYHTTDSALYLIPVWMFGAWAIARGLLSISTWASSHMRHVQPVILLLLVFLFGPALNVITQYPAMNLRDDHTAVDFANSVINTAPSKAILITGSDGHTFALWYHRLATGARPDLTIVDRRLAGYEWYAAMLAAQGAAPQLPEYDPADSWLVRLATVNPGRMICVVAEKTAAITCD
jgi:hypothetical protein